MLLWEQFACTQVAPLVVLDVKRVNPHLPNSIMSTLSSVRQDANDVNNVARRDPASPACRHNNIVGGAPN
eukprot:6539278-Pyramimonas_sp.AAC.1